MAQTFHANKYQILTKIIIPANKATFFNSLKVNIGLSLVGVITGEFLVSKAGLGYLIVYGGQVFQLDLVMTSVIILRGNGNSFLPRDSTFRKNYKQNWKI